MPPAVGYADTSSAMEKATSRTSPQTIGQPIDAMIGPPLFHPNEYAVKQPARTEMIVNEIAKFENELPARGSACPKPGSGSRSVSASCSAGGLTPAAVLTSASSWGGKG